MGFVSHERDGVHSILLCISPCFTVLFGRDPVSSPVFSLLSQKSLGYDYIHLFHNFYSVLKLVNGSVLCQYRVVLITIGSQYVLILYVLWQPHFVVYFHDYISYSRPFIGLYEFCDMFSSIESVVGILKWVTLDLLIILVVWIFYQYQFYQPTKMGIFPFLKGLFHLLG